MNEPNKGAVVALAITAGLVGSLTVLALELLPGVRIGPERVVLNR